MRPYRFGPGNKQLKLALAFGSLGPRSLLGLFGPLGGLLWMLDRSLFVILLHFSIVVPSPVEAGSLLSVFCAFCRLLGVLRPLFAHGVSFFPLKTSGALHWFFCCTHPERITQPSAPR